MGDTPEGRVKKAICDYLSLCHKDVMFWLNASVGIWDPRTKRYLKNTSKYALNGTSDILGLLWDGRFLAIEVKSFKGKLSDGQRDFLARVNRQGGLGFYAKNVNDVRERLSGEKAKILRT